MGSVRGDFNSIFLTVVGIFLLGVAISALRIRVMTELDELDNFPGTAGSAGYLLNPETQSSSGVAESGSNAIDGEQ